MTLFTYMCMCVKHIYNRSEPNNKKGKNRFLKYKKKHFNFKSKNMPSETKQENISFILSVMKDLEQEDKND